MLPSSPSTALVAAGIAGAAFVAYCVYFDRKRRMDPLYKQKVRERRQKARKSKQQGIVLPDFENTEAMHKFFLQEVHTGEELLSMGDIDGGVDHLSAAVAVCYQPTELLHILQQSLPPEVFQRILAKLPKISTQMRSKYEEDVRVD